MAKIPVVPGNGDPPFEYDSDDYLRLVTLPEACSEIDPMLWTLFTDVDTSHVRCPAVEGVE